MDKFFATMVHDASQLHPTETVKRLATDNMTSYPTLHGERLTPGVRVCVILTLDHYKPCVCFETFREKGKQVSKLPQFAEHKILLLPGIRSEIFVIFFETLRSRIIYAN